MIPNATLPRRPPARVSRHHAWNNPGTSASPYRARNVAFGAGGGFASGTGGSGGGAGARRRAATVDPAATVFRPLTGRRPDAGRVVVVVVVKVFATDAVTRVDRGVAVVVRSADE